MSESKHDAFIDQFSEYYDGELEGEALRALEEHLEECSACGQEYEAFKESLSLFGALRETSAPDDLLREVTTTIRRQSRGNFFNERWIFGVRVPYEAFFALLIAVIAAIYLVGQEASAPLQLEGTSAPVNDEQGLGEESHRAHLTLPSQTDLSELSRFLRLRGFEVRPLLEGGREGVELTMEVGELSGVVRSLSALIQVPLESPYVPADAPRLTLSLWLDSPRGGV